MAINSKLGDVSQNSYVTISQANTYFTNRRNVTNWTSLTATNKEIALIQAARELDRYRFYGDRYYESQGMQFPRDDHEIVTGNCASPITATSFTHANLYSSTYSTMPSNYWKDGSIHITSGTPVRDTRLISSSSVSNGAVVASPSFSATPTTNSQFIIFKPIYKDIQDAQCEQALYLIENNKMEALSEYKAMGVNTVKIGDAMVTFTDGYASLSLTPIAKKLLLKFIEKSLRVNRA